MGILLLLRSFSLRQLLCRLFDLRLILDGFHLLIDSLLNKLSCIIQLLLQLLILLLLLLLLNILLRLFRTLLAGFLFSVLSERDLRC